VRKLSLPASLVFVVTAAACGGDDAPVVDAGPTAIDADVCAYICYPQQFHDDGGVIEPGTVTCPKCAVGPEHDCGKDCQFSPIV
jgi:hypothetical protein